MPPKKRSSARSRPRPKQKTKGGGRKSGFGPRAGTVSVIPMPQFADSERVTLRFTEGITATNGAAGTDAAYQFSLNDPNKCDVTGATGVAQGMAIMQAKYNKLVCYGSRIRLQVTQLTDNTSFASVNLLGNACLYPLEKNASGASSALNARVQKYAKYHNFPPRGAATDFACLGSSLNRWDVSHVMTVSKLVGEPNLRQPIYECLSTASPTNVQTWVLNTQDILADTTGKFKWNAIVDILYDCEFYGRVTIGNALSPREAPILRQIDFGLRPVFDGVPVLARDEEKKDSTWESLSVPGSPKL